MLASVLGEETMKESHMPSADAALEIATMCGISTNLQKNNAYRETGELAG